ncbi:hypothetical protein TSOC_009006 [Tetrabaena socialis]|uniref:Uncharacterized protein n=1 Tax=Tetrabaena socialis TaxID=47790 RepID=A0A2J7ZX38_9CHLO|nr:hypothetical protein TSOC_009006 [Tetrabaena socialis]|eukprot:PNH04841.1 hypothetical protein TSOC_009006 [Tetrabaena socialis]
MAGILQRGGLLTTGSYSSALAPPPLRHPQQRLSCRAQARPDRVRDRSRGVVGPATEWHSAEWPGMLVSETRSPSARGAMPEHGAPRGLPYLPPMHDTEVSRALPQDGSSSEALTVLTIRFTTGCARGSALSDPYAAVNVCLIGQDGTGALHRISPINDPRDSQAHNVEMCELIGPDVGADCSTVLSAQQQQQPASTSSTSSRGAMATDCPGQPQPPPPKRRFQEGSVDEVSILVQELGPLSGVLVGVEGGTWYLDELDIVSSRTYHLDRFVCRRMLGGRVGEGAALLTPVPVGSVVYGEGKAAMVLTKEQASALWALNMTEFDDLKRRLSTTTALLVASGASLTALIGGTAAALPYVMGGIVGLVYQWMLMHRVDHIMEASSSRKGRLAQQEGEEEAYDGPDQVAADFSGEGDGRPAPAAQVTAFGGEGAAGRLLASAPVRLGFVCASALLGLALLSQEEAATGGAFVLPVPAGGDGPSAALQLALGAAGFLMYKIALVATQVGDGGAARPSSLLQRQASDVRKFKRD